MIPMQILLPAELKARLLNASDTAGVCLSALVRQSVITFLETFDASHENKEAKPPRKEIPGGRESP